MSTIASPVQRLPVTIITGFLGSGKTTFISNMLRRPDMAGTGVIVNEFAALGIDDLVIGADKNRRDGEVILLKNGCVCCSPADDLVNAVLRLHRTLSESAQGMGRLLIETSGLADPIPLLQRLVRDLRLRPLIRLAGVVALVDAVHGLNQMGQHDVIRKQLAVADRRIITKDDIASGQAVRALATRLRDMNPGAPVIVGQANAQMTPDLIEAGLFDGSGSAPDLPRWFNIGAYRSDQAQHAETFQSWLVESEAAIDWESFLERLGPLIRQPDNGVLRIKGILRTTQSEQPLVIQGVQSDFYRPVMLERWPANLRNSAIVVIGRASAAGFVDALRALVRQTEAAGAARIQGTERGSIAH